MSGTTDLTAIRDMAVGLVGRWVAQGKIVVGGVDDAAFVSWSGGTSEASEHIARRWFDLEDPAASGDELFWIAVTDEGRKFRLATPQ